MGDERFIVGDLVGNLLDDRIGIVVRVEPRSEYRKFIYKVLWSTSSSHLPGSGFVGAAWGHNLELISEGW